MAFVTPLAAPVSITHITAMKLKPITCFAASVMTLGVFGADFYLHTVPEDYPGQPDGPSPAVMMMSTSVSAAPIIDSTIMDGISYVVVEPPALPITLV